jgi:hypothetical protein
MPLSAKEHDNPNFLVTPGLLHDDPVPILFSLSIAKAAQRTLVLSPQRLYPDIHVALLLIEAALVSRGKREIR